MAPSPDIVIVGPGMGGAKVAAGLAAAGASVLILERGERLQPATGRSLRPSRRAGQALRPDLAARGHRIERLDDWTHWTGGVCAVRRDLATGELEAAADPRRWSRAPGW